VPTPLAVNGQTNETPNTVTDLKCDWPAFWTLAQQYALSQIVTHAPVCQDKPDYRNGSPGIANDSANKSAPRFVSNFAVRARRIAAAYAAVFLEDFPHGRDEFVGRFYWLGLGAFAAKQVAVTLENPLLRASGHTGWPTYALLGQGNLWLFNDILPWFYGYACDPASFKESSRKRHSNDFLDPVSRHFALQLDYKDVIAKTPMERNKITGAIENGKLGYLQVTQQVTDGFDYVRQWEAASGDDISRQKFAMNHLYSIAYHEQGEVLQGLIYDRILFDIGLDAQSVILSEKPTDNIIVATVMGLGGITAYGLSKLAHAYIPALELVLTSADRTADSGYKSVPDGAIALQDYVQRMAWITQAAKKYNKLMTTRTEEMYSYIREIATFGDLPDTP
jgi:hypothetical protein